MRQGDLEPQLIELTCPDDCGPGDRIQVALPDEPDFLFDVVVPDGVGPGDDFTYDVGPIELDSQMEASPPAHCSSSQRRAAFRTR